MLIMETFSGKQNSDSKGIIHDGCAALSSQHHRSVSYCTGHATRPESHNTGLVKLCKVILDNVTIFQGRLVRYHRIRKVTGVSAPVSIP